MEGFEAWWREEIDKCLTPPTPERMAKLAWEAALKSKTDTGATVPLDRLVMSHWYCFSYAGESSESGSQCQACTYVGYEEKLVTKPMIEANKKTAGVKEGAVLMAVSYLGHMTREEMIGS